MTKTDTNRTSPMRTCRSIHIAFKYVVVFRNLKGHNGAHYKSDQHAISNLCALCWPQSHGLVWTAGMTCTVYPGDTDHSAPLLLMDGWMANRDTTCRKQHEWMNGKLNTTCRKQHGIGWIANRTQPAENNMDKFWMNGKLDTTCRKWHGWLKGKLDTTCRKHGWMNGKSDTTCRKQYGWLNGKLDTTWRKQHGWMNGKSDTTCTKQHGWMNGKSDTTCKKLRKEFSFQGQLANMLDSKSSGLSSTSGPGHCSVTNMILLVLLLDTTGWKTI